MNKRSHFGTVRKLPSGKHQARYLSDDGKRHTAGTFGTAKAAWTELAKIQTRLESGLWRDDRSADLGFRDFAADVMAVYSADKAPRTMEGYRSLLRRWLLPTFGDLPLKKITTERVDKWWSSTGKSAGVVTRRNAYYLLRGILGHAVRWGRLDRSPCTVQDAGADVSTPRPYLSVVEFASIVDSMPSRFHAPMWTMFGAHLRLSELVALNVGDIDLSTGRVAVTKQLQQVSGEGLVQRETKTKKQRSPVMLAPALDALTDYLAAYPALPNAPLFVGDHGRRLSHGSIRKAWNVAREQVGLKWAHLHDSRHTSLTLTAQFSTPRENMKRAGHSTQAAALRYQHATEERDSTIASAASAEFSRVRTG